MYIIYIYMYVSYGGYDAIIYVIESSFSRRESLYRNKKNVIYGATGATIFEKSGMSCEQVRHSPHNLNSHLILLQDSKNSSHSWSQTIYNTRTVLMPARKHSFSSSYSFSFFFYSLEWSCNEASLMEDPQYFSMKAARWMCYQCNRIKYIYG